MTAYVLLNGSYSDEHIVAVFSSMELASAAAQIFTDEAHIDEFEIDACAEDMRQSRIPYFVRLSRETGDTMDVHCEVSSYGAFSSAVLEDVNKNLYTQCWASDDKHAIKIASDRRAEFLAKERR